MVLNIMHDSYLNKNNQQIDSVLQNNKDMQLFMNICANISK